MDKSKLISMDKSINKNLNGKKYISAIFFVESKLEKDLNGET